jgi:hypothetical protein
MRTATCLLPIVILLLCVTQNAFGEDILFKDDFKHGLSDHWKIVGLKDTDYRIRDGGLEIRVQSGKPTRDLPMLKVILPFASEDDVIASVKVTVLDEFTADHEYAGIGYVNENGLVFRGKKERIDGKLVFAPGKYQFKGKEGEEGNQRKYDVKYTTATKEAGSLRIILRSGEAFFQVGPSANDQYLNFFHSAVGEPKKERGFCLLAIGAPEGKPHWVRFEDFRVVKQ